MATWALDLHVHTRFSPDGITRPENIVAAAKRAGLSGIAITDHDRRGAYDRLVRLGLANPTGVPVDGFLVIPGVEVSCREGHLLVIGATFDAPAGITAHEAIDKAHALGGLAIAAHPCDRSRSGMGLDLLDTLALDGIEGWNSKTLSKKANLAAIRYAERRNLPVVAGSDAHFAKTVGRSHTKIEAPSLTVASILMAIAAGRTELVQGQHTKRELARYWAQGWLTRPWLLDYGVRKVKGRRAQVLRNRARTKAAAASTDAASLLPPVMPA